MRAGWGAVVMPRGECGHAKSVCATEVGWLGQGKSVRHMDGLCRTRVDSPKPCGGRQVEAGRSCHYDGGLAWLLCVLLAQPTKIVHHQSSGAVVALASD
jgi:hypothetical protein